MSEVRMGFVDGWCLPSVDHCTKENTGMALQWQMMWLFYAANVLEGLF